ncbi:MAG: DEAD/DEAH box helicase [Colwellia sp.]|nr:DEAD/DEAH box helicase [Colwellia sp.]
MSSTALKQVKSLSRIDLEDYQVRAVEYVNANPKCALWVDCGLGKTAVTLTAMAHQLMSFMVNKVLVVAPLTVCESTWPDEIEKWRDLFSFTPKVSMILGKSKDRFKAINADADIYIINIENFIWLLNNLYKDWPFDWVVLDESSLFSAHNAVRFKKFRCVLDQIDRVTQLTGTPASNGLMKVWSQIYLLDKGKRLGKNITAFRRKYYSTYRLDTHIQYTILPKADDEIHDQLRDIVFRLDADDYLKMEPLKKVFHQIHLGVKARKFYTKLANELIVELENGKTVTAVNAAVLTNKLLQCANGAVYIDDTKDWEHIHDHKLDMLEHIIAETDAPVLVGYNFKSDLVRLQKRFPKAISIKEDNAVKRWNNREIPILLAHPASAGHGLNLQTGGNVLVWFGLNWSLELFLQFNARLRRKGQEKPVICHLLIADNTVDDTVIKALEGKEVTQNNLLNALKTQVAA